MILVASDDLSKLSPCELAVVQGLSIGLTPSQIARKRNRSTKTVESQALLAMQKIGVKNIYQLRAFAAIKLGGYRVKSADALPA